MEFEDALFRWVADQSPITANIGAAPQVVRFFKGKAPQGVKAPFMIQRRGGVDEQTMRCRIDGAVAVSMQIDSYGKTWPEMAATARAFRNALKPDVVNAGAGFPVYMGAVDSPGDGVKVKAAILENEFDTDDPDPGLIRRTQLWTFWIWQP